MSRSGGSLRAGLGVRYWLCYGARDWRRCLQWQIVHYSYALPSRSYHEMSSHSRDQVTVHPKNDGRWSYPTGDFVISSISDKHVDVELSKLRPLDTWTQYVVGLQIHWRRSTHAVTQSSGVNHIFVIMLFVTLSFLKYHCTKYHFVRCTFVISFLHTFFLI